MATPAVVTPEPVKRTAPGFRPGVFFQLGDTESVAEQAAMGAWTVESAQTITIELHADGPSGDAVSDTLDQLELEAEQALAALNATSNVIEKIEPAGSAIVTNMETDRPFAVRSLTWVAAWRHNLGAPDVRV